MTTSRLRGEAPVAVRGCRWFETGRRGKQKSSDGEQDEHRKDDEPGVFDAHHQAACEPAEQEASGRGSSRIAVEGVDSGKQRCGDCHVRGGESAIRENVGIEDEEKQRDGCRDISEHLARSKKDQKPEREGEDGHREASPEKHPVRIMRVKEDPSADGRCCAEIDRQRRLHIEMHRQKRKCGHILATGGCSGSMPKSPCFQYE